MMDMMDEKQTTLEDGIEIIMKNEQTLKDVINAIYDDMGFKGVIEFIENHFEEKGLYVLYTSGWSEDKILIDVTVLKNYKKQ